MTNDLTLASLGRLFTADMERDAVHIAVAPVRAHERLAPGQSASFTEEWKLIPFPFPQNGVSVDLSLVRAAVGN